MINYMICPCCGGAIELENDSEGVCDVCATRMVAGEIIRDTNCTENEIEPTARRERRYIYDQS